MSEIEGRYPGGPRRSREEEISGRRRSRALRKAEETEARIAHSQRRRAQRRRRRRVILGFVLAFLAAGGIGFWLGLQTHRTPQEIAREEEGSESSDGIDLTRERNAILQQLWLMEDLERARRP